jgi:hypothetical protein
MVILIMRQSKAQTISIWIVPLRPMANRRGFAADIVLTTDDLDFSRFGWQPVDAGLLLRIPRREG